MRRRLKRKYNKEQIHALYENAGLYYQLNKEPIRALEMYQKQGERADCVFADRKCENRTK